MIRQVKLSVLFLIVGSLFLVAACGSKEVIREVEVPGETVIVEQQVIKEVEVPGETIIVEQEVIKEVEVPGETVIVEVVVIPTPSPRKLARVTYINAGADPPTLDPALATDSVSINMVENLFVGLTNFNPNTSEVEPDLATSWDVSSDGTVYTFHLRDDVRWSDGMPVTAQDVVYGIRRTLDPMTASTYSYVLTTVIKNGEAFNSGDISDASLVGATAIDDYTVRIELEHAAGYFPGIASMWVMYPQPRAAIEAYGDQWTDPENIVTNGPYELLTWVHNANLIMEKNQDYYDAANVPIDTVDYKMIEEASTSMAMYEAGALDTIGSGFSSVPLEDMDRIKNDPILSKELLIAPALVTYYYGFTVDKPPFDNVLVRKAFVASIDRDSLIEFVLKGGQKPALTFTAPGNFGAVDAVAEGIGIPFDPEQARTWLTEAGYPNGEGLPEVTLMYNTSESHQKIAETIGAMWKEHLNVDVNVVNQEWKVYLVTLENDPPQVWRLG